MPANRTRRPPLYAYVGEAYGISSGDMRSGTLEAWRRAFTAVCAVNGWRYHGLVTHDDGSTFIDPISGETILERLPDTRKENE